jgi:choline dehydrogenase-like flavoprotein
VRTNAALAYLQPALARPNLTVWHSTVARRLIVRAGKAELIELGGERTGDAVSAREIVLSLGAIETPHLLMLSGIGPAHLLASLGIRPLVDLPGVGENLSDHPVVRVVVPIVADPEPDSRVLVGLGYTSPTSKRRSDVFVSAAPADLEGIRSVEGQSHPSLIVMVSGYWSGSKGCVALRSARPEDPPIVCFNYLTESDDRDRLRDGVRLAMRVAKSDAFDGLVGPPLALSPADLESDESLDVWIRQALITAFHGCGTCAIGPDADSNAVVDEYGSVHGLDNVRIADLSIVPQVPRAPTNATAFVVGERVAAFMAAA